jgi:nitrate/nitrite transporter NarK
VPFDGLAFLIILFLLDIETPKTPILAGLKAIDWLGSVTIVCGTVMFLLGLEYGGISYPWDSATVICLIIFGLLVIGLFFLNEWKLAKYPIMPLRIFKYRSNIASLIVCFIHGMVFIAGAFFLPLYFQAVFGASPILSGVYLFPFVLSLSFSSAMVGIFIKKTGQYLPPIWFGITFMTLGFGLFIDLPSGHHSWARIIIYQLIAGIGAGPNFQSPLLALQTKVHPNDIASATATFGFTRNLSTAISVVIGGVIFQNGMSKREGTLRASLGQRIAMELGGGGAGASTGIVQGLPPAQKDIATKTYTESLKMMWVFYTCVAAVGVAVSLLIQRHTLSKSHQVQKTGLAAQEKARLARMSQDVAKKEKRAVETGTKSKEEV